MKILCCSAGLSYQVDASYSTRLRANAMIEAGAEVVVLGFPQTYPADGKPCLFQYRSVWEGATEKRRAGWARWRKRLGKYWTFLVEPLIVKWEALRMMKSGGFDVLYLTHLEPVLMLFLLPLVRLRRVPVFGMIPTVFHTENSSEGRPLVSTIRAVVNHHVAKWLPRHMHVVANSRHVFSVMHMTGLPNTAVVQEGYEDLIGLRDPAAARTRLGLPPGRRMLLLLGVASRAKGADLLFRAMEQIPPSFVLCVVGQTGGVYESTWGDLTRLKEKGWGELIRIDDRYVTEDELMDYYAACDAVVVPYRKGFATSSTHLRHASEYGKAIIACDQYLIGELVRHYDLGLLFEPDNIASLAESLRAFNSKDEAWLKQIERNAAVINRELSWAKTGQEYVRLFAEALRTAR